MESGHNPRKRQRVQDDEHQITTQSDTSSSTRLKDIPQMALNNASKALQSLQFHLTPKSNDESEDDEDIVNKLKYVWFTVTTTLEQDPALKAQFTNMNDFLDKAMKKEQKPFIDSLRAMAVKSQTMGSKAWEGLFEDDIFMKEIQAPIVVTHPTFDQEITQLAWKQVFRGDAAEVLLQTISSYLDKETHPYSRQATIVNSSGTGKSRMVDALATKIITVPMCLRSDSSTGYPPPDSNLQAWLIAGEMNDRAQDKIRRRLQAFVYALLTVTRTTLAEFSFEPDSEVEKLSETRAAELYQEKLAYAFHQSMTEGQSYRGPNAFRKNFYNNVIREASEFTETDYSLSKLQSAVAQLTTLVDPENLLDCNGPLPRRPLVILSFDEAHTLTDNPPVNGRATNWNMFSELRRILRHISGHAIFALFLSTAGRFNLFTPEISSDPSRRIQDSRLLTLDPITEISFDGLANKVRENKVMLQEVTEMKWMCHLGRPLFASIYDAQEFHDPHEPVLLEFAKVKLLDGPDTLESKNQSGTLACLSVRFALEFNMDGTASNVAQTQVERHMRLCIAASARRDTLVTIAGSEPLLAEAAYELMRGSQSNPVHHLATHSDLNCVDRGRRGELVASLLIMRACDAARAKLPSQRWVPVNVFMEELLPSTSYETLYESFPISHRKDEKKKFKETFKDYGIWFNHIIKVEESIHSAEHIWKFITRGAMILCSHNQEAIDVVIPICHTKEALSRDSVSAILVQVKNTTKYQTITPSLFDYMNPIKLLFTKDLKVNPKPVIRIVFALAAVNTGVYFRPERKRTHRDDQFTAFDIWCGGLGNNVFKHIDNDLLSYQFLLERSLRSHDAFELTGNKNEAEGHKKVRELRASLRQRMAPLISGDKGHHWIYLTEEDEEEVSS